MELIWNILLLSIVVFLVAKLLPGIYLKGFGTAIIVAVVYSIINFLIGWLLTLLALPLLILTLGLFKFVINGFLLWITDKLIKDFRIEGCLTTILAAFLITVFSTLLQWIF
ncbi:MAG: phage holin family protein [Calditrichia bacterium]